MSKLISRCSTSDSDFQMQLERLLNWEQRESPEVASQVQEIVDTVRAEGDDALLDYTRRLDQIEADSIADLRLDRDYLEQCWRLASEAEKDALRIAQSRIREFHRKQLDEGFELTDDYQNVLGQRITPLQRTGVYVPGGQAAYPSSVLMTVEPAMVAGVNEVVVVVPTPGGQVNELLCAALFLADVDEVWRIGGAQAVAALAFGTESIRPVDKIVGPGGKWVTAAKKIVFGPVGIDIMAGPSEILVIADGSVPARWTALDLMSQAEHDVAAQAILVSPCSTYVDAVESELHGLLDRMPRREILESSLSERGALIQARDLEEAVSIANRVAPEHLQLAVAEPRSLLDQVRNAGAIFLGAHSAEVLGDYVAGPSHVLPTFGTARYASPLGVYDFVKRSSVIELSPQGADVLARHAATMADAEGLHSHAAAARVRIAGFDDNVI